MQLVNRPNSLESAVEEELNSTHEVALAENWDTPTWTKEIKVRLGNVGSARTFGVYSHEHREEPESRAEWLFDLTFLQQRQGCLERCILALESEWGGRQAISDDFQKLMVARTDHRIMIFEAASREGAEQLIQGLLEDVLQFQGAQFGDRYLFAAWVHPIGFLFHTHVVGFTA